MSNINLLDSTVYNKISAGEVVERPASVIKELVENSLDAGATSITVEVEKGGAQLLSVRDNGGGISYDDLKNAFLPHATSKIKTAEDLEEILSLGFRGEALASIAAVSMVELESKTPDAEYGGRIEIHGGEVQAVQEAGCANGTSVTVRNLFYNTPARAKFLRKPKQEEAEITNLLSRYILINHQIQFQYFADGKLVYQSNGTGLKDAIYIIYGKETSENLLPVDWEEGELHVSGFVGKPGFAKSNRTYQTTALNGRYIVNSTISAALYNVFGDFLMKRTYPFYVLFMESPPGRIDVNVHPNKMDVRFENDSKVYSLFYQGALHAIADFNRMTSFSGVRQQSDEMDMSGEAPPQAQNIVSNPVNVIRQFVQEQASNPPASSDWNVEWSKGIDSDAHEKKLDVLVFRDSGAVQENSTDSLQTEEVPEVKQETLLPPVQQTLPIPETYRVIGQLFQTYILLEYQDSLVLIDQHAAHERLLFDKLTAEFSQKEVQAQTLLIPYVFTLNSLEFEYFRDILPQLLSLGFDVDEFGSNVYKISSVPSALANIRLSEFIDELLQDITVVKRIKIVDSLKDYLAQKACKAAVKAGNALEPSEIEVLLQDIRSGCVTQCPHGRPALYSVSRKDVEKWFKRIV